ncbi:MAG: DUF1667 domain-containing protein [Oscillospiraceae bacterium]|nr:DUF1667 domain-containing protein [Oscillospiraceae bacterium]
MRELVCIVCPRGCRLTVDEANDMAVSGNFCKRGEKYAKKEVTSPERVLTTTVAISGAAIVRCPARTDIEIPKDLVMKAAAQAALVRVSAPVTVGQVLLENICGTGAKLIATRNINRI